MTEEEITPNSDDLELVQRVLELTTYLEKNTISIDELKTEISNIKSNHQELDIELGKKFNEFKESFDAKLKTVEENSVTEIQALRQSLEDQKEYFTSEVKALTEVIGTQENHFNDKFSSQKEENEKTHTLFTTQDEKIVKLTEELKEGHTEFSNRLIETESSLKASVSGLGDLLRTQFETLTKNANSMENNIISLDNLTQSHTEAFNSVRESLQSFKEKLQEIISITKKDQQIHFENFSRMLESFNENIRTEITLTAQNLKESDIQILNEVSEHYTRKKVGEELQQSFASFSEELQLQTTRTREEMTQNIQNSMGEYESKIESQSQSIQTYKEELERIQSEIQAVIDRKVNEKYEAVFSLLSTVALHAEELSMLLKTAEIHLPKINPPIVDNKDEEAPTNQNLNENT